MKMSKSAYHQTKKPGEGHDQEHYICRPSQQTSDCTCLIWNVYFAHKMTLHDTDTQREVRKVSCQLVSFGKCDKSVLKNARMHILLAQQQEEILADVKRLLLHKGCILACVIQQEPQITSWHLQGMLFHIKLVNMNHLSRIPQTLVYFHGI